jgi:predicted ATPase
VIAPEHRATVASICVQLDKLPLAIELANGQLAGQQPLAKRLSWLLAQLEAGHDVPRGDGEPGRHRTLRAAIGWSHELCTPSERLLWARLSVFTRRFSRADAQDVCGGDQLPGETVAACLSLLAERSVLLASRAPDGSTSYLLPATLQAYGRRMLRRLGQEEEFTARYQRWQEGRRPRPQHGAAAGK